MKSFALLTLLVALAACAHAQTIERVMPQAAQLCANCHLQILEQQRTPDAQLTPLLGNQQPKYLESALLAYAKRQRDHFFMRGIAAGLDREQIDDVVRYFSSASPAVKRLDVTLPKMPSNAELCVSCHGDASRRPAAEDIPRLAGQHVPYLKGAFLSYVDGSRRHVVMQGVARDAKGEPVLSSEDLEAVLRWYSALPNGVSGH